MKKSPLSKNAEKIFKRKYTVNDEETWEQACLRVAEHIAGAEKKENQEFYTEQFYDLMYNLVMIPGGRIIANSGTAIKNLQNCFVLDLKDTRRSIYDTLGKAADIFAQGGGLGINYSELREKGHPLSTGTGASGPIAFMKLFNDTGDLIQQVSRRAAQMGMINCDHPDILEFIRSKAELDKRNKLLEEEFLSYSGTDKRNKEYQVLHRILLDNQLTYMNISVLLTDKFMEACEKDLDWELISPKDGEVKSVVKANEILNLIAQRAWESGDPGVGFIDRVNEDHIAKYLGLIKASNPCGEQFMLNGESCCLSAINLHSVYNEETKEIDYEFLEHVVRTTTRFLDNVITVSDTGIDVIKNATKNLRRIGLGIFGWADLLAELEIPYDSEEAYELARNVSWFITYIAYLESNKLAKERGAFPMLDMQKADLKPIHKILERAYPETWTEKEKWYYTKNFEIRNISVTNVAPTGSTSLLAGKNSGIEPFFMLAYRRNITDGEGNLAKDSIIEFNPILSKKLGELGLSEDKIEKIKEKVSRTGSVQDIKEIPQNLKDVFKTSHEIEWKDHVKNQAAWQEYISGSISKTINMPNDCTVEDMKEAIVLAWKSRLKGVALYRDGSKVFQVLNKNG